MKRMLLTLLLLFLCLPVVLAAVAVQPDTTAMIVSEILPGDAYIPKGTMIRAELLTEVNSGKNKVGDKIYFKVLEDIKLGDAVVVAKGTTGEGYVKTVKRAGMFGKGGAIELDASNVQTRNGVEVPLTMDVSKYGGDNRIEINYNNSVETAIISGLLPGSNQKIKAGTILSILVPFNVDLQVKPEGLLAATAPTEGSLSVPAKKPYLQAAPSAESPYVEGNAWEYAGEKGSVHFNILQNGKKTIKGHLRSAGPAVLTIDQDFEVSKGDLYITLKAKDKETGKSYPLQIFLREDGTAQYIVPNSPKDDKESIILYRIAK